jgi:hypothetical protein
MFKKLSILAILAVIAVVAVGSSMAKASGDPCAGVTVKNKYGETCTQFLTAQNAPGKALSGSDTVESAATAYAAASTSQSYEVASGMTLAQATGITPMTASQQQALAAADGLSVMALSASPTCVYGKRQWQWGAWPAQQIVTDHTHRCYNGSIVTYRATTVTQDVTLCNIDGTKTFKSAGGTGTGYVRWDDVGYFDCPFPLTDGFLLDPHHTRTIILEATGGGGYWIWSAS